MNNKKPLRILYVVYTFVPDGSSIALLNLLDGMAINKVSSLIIMSKKGSLCIELERRNIPYKVVPYLLSRYHRFYNVMKDCVLYIPILSYMLLLNIKATNKLKYIAKAFKPDIIHTNIGPSHIGYKVAKELGIPHIWHLREFQGGHFSMRPFPSLKRFKEMIQSSYTIAISSEIYNYFSLSGNARVIYDGVSKLSQIKFLTPKSKYFLFVGQLVKTKGIEKLIDAYIDYAKGDDEFDLYIAGTGKKEYICRLNRKISDASLTKRINFLGSRRDVSDLMAWATAIIVPSFFEGFGLVVAEAMFNGCLVIGNNATATKEQFDNGLKQHGTEIALRYTGHKELVTAMHTVSEKGIEYYFPMIMLAQATVASLYSQERNAAEIYKFYEEILENNNPKNKTNLN